ncbi:HAM-2, protein required for hyphal anastomosis [Cordyceps fumosorosea ARSEF 2679]|uniref:HAM-2, protein required for hyphal anastomosis n=1 Tax=Cordyceps fumosorosea (strain ARSEF 2679) TaxID=1081104 RepID=A0A167YB65_CORFA|nr:HAM-2, protein required for hyphal anastomosis [Cordyceps fumosorosea ARSEF 2679]OAA66101.1 HAM-2, protein required for hyphal anastomosis [Cordyceps fumosorosea ARSEF 2679]
MSALDAAKDDGTVQIPVATGQGPTTSVTEVPADDEATKADIEMDVKDMGQVAGGKLGTETTEKLPLAPPPAATRPILQRNALQRAALEIPGGSATPTPMPQAPAPPLPTDSLSLAQLRKIVSEVNRPEQPAYDFTYADMGPHAEEIDEWFMYQFWQWVRLSSAQKAFEWHWSQETAAAEGGYEVAWEDADHETRTRFVRAAIAGVQSNDAALRSASIGKLVYLVLGRWGDTAVPHAAAEEEGEGRDGDGATKGKGTGRSIASLMQLQAIKAGVECLASLEGLPVVWEALRHAFELQWSGDAPSGQAGAAQGNSSQQEPHDELMNLMTIMYIALQEVLSDPEDMSASYGKLLELQPPLTEFMMTATTKLRWDEQNALPQTQILLLFWKSILLVFGGTKDLQRVKKAISELSENQGKETITASPLDYHVFRQEITSKYPSYVPPRPAIPLEEDNTSLLPPLPQHPARNNGANGILPAPASAQNGGGASILHQPVHIATPAPSPPPSPGVGGKGGKKQNYQTNQNFPFMYPPLDATSNSAGGKGLAALDDRINRRWEGSHIPASILEAGELFSTRVRMTRATRQLWDEREAFLKFERGWEADEDNDDVEELDLSELTEEERELIKEVKGADKEPRRPAAPAEAVDFGPRKQEMSDRDKKRLEAVESFYHQALPHLQSLVIVLLRPVFANVAAIVAQQGPQGPHMNQGMPGRNGPGMNGGPNPDNGRPPADAPELSPEEVDAARTREITTKAMSGILVLLLKWLRLSHILRFEYMTQLLLDSNYIPLVLKLFAHQDVQQVVDSKLDRLENSFFQFCNLRSRFKDRTDSDLDNEDEDDEAEDQANSAPEHESEAEESDDSAAPPPIKKYRSPPAEVSTSEQPAEPPGRSAAVEDGGNQGGSMRPEVDELGYPVHDLPTEPITDFSWRNFFSLINYLRLMQKVCKGKAHRNLLLVQYKSSTILRRALRVPQPALRLYTLKLFKNQVPYCGRKWRQSNMRVITAVYLHCRPELRDEWLAGSDVDAEVDSALPLEQALRGLTHWFNVRRYPDKTLLAPGGDAVGEGKEAARKDRRGSIAQQDFFTRELERLDLDWAEVSGDESMGEMENW